jgi:hypothetical protein
MPCLRKFRHHFVRICVSASIVAPFFSCKASLLFVVFLAYAVWLLIVQLHIHLLGSDFGLAAQLKFQIARLR